MFSRRRFLNMLGIIIGLLFGLPFLVNAKPLSLGLEKVPKLKKIGGWTILKIKGRSLMFIRNTETTVHLVDPICTHRECMLTYNQKSQRIECPCHQSMFDLNGQVLQGPASQHLQTFEARLSGENIIFSLD